MDNSNYITVAVAVVGTAFTIYQWFADNRALHRIRAHLELLALLEKQSSNYKLVKDRTDFLVLREYGPDRRWRRKQWKMAGMGIVWLVCAIYVIPMTRPTWMENVLLVLASVNGVGVLLILLDLWMRMD